MWQKMFGLAFARVHIKRIHRTCYDIMLVRVLRVRRESDANIFCMINIIEYHFCCVYVCGSGQTIQARSDWRLNLICLL